MSKLRHSLRFRLAITFALFGMLVSLMLSTGMFIAAHNFGVRLMDETMNTEIEDFLARRLHYPQASLTATITIRGYVHQPGQIKEGLPQELALLTPGEYQIKADNIPYRVAVVDKGGERFVMMYNASTQQHRERIFLGYLAMSTLVMVLFSAWMGWWLAGRIVSPIAELARRVGIALPEEDEQKITLGFADDEIGKLAAVFGSYLKRMKSFIDRESAFTADVSHELRTPLAIVQGVVELMQEDSHLDGKQQERIARMARANREMIDITSALLLMAREQNPDEPVMQQCDVWDVVANAVEAYRHLVNENTRIELDCAHPIHVAAERTLLSIVVSNLIRNAFAYTPSGTVAITLDQNSLTITDTGSGIRNEEVGKIFDRHYKGKESTGEGIGLSLVKRICERYHWKTMVQSEAGKGTTARLFFYLG